ncbi:hypothetical protein [Prochlorococcus sp. MIT 1307]|uniref:hypothetical protein n=1 Tax=Prochlorococcus sp. MIT 1307 TaxID=3096219 RepID=UPI002A74D5E5|nr:hypothetical protein [Prochlorococcus sp. MIT 1307]
MAFTSSNQGNDRYYNNADSFAMAFDDKWKSFSSQPNKSVTSKEEKIKIILSEIKDHPFLNEYPREAKKIAEFRLRLLKLD